MKLKPFFLTAGTEAYAKKRSVIQPLARWQPSIPFSDLDTFGYVLWHELLVFPIFDEQGLAEVRFPKGNKWVYYYDHSRIFEGGTHQDLLFPIDETPLFMKANSTFVTKE